MHLYILRLLTGPAAPQSTNLNDLQDNFNQQLSTQEKTFLSLLLTNSNHAKDLIAKKTPHAIANEPNIIKAGMYRP